MPIDCQHLSVVFAGTPAFAATALSALLGSEHRVVGVLTQPDRPAGRGRQLQASPVKQRALEADVPVLQPTTLKDAATVAELAAWRPDVMVVAAYGLILPPPVLALPPLGCLNIHGSRLPRWRGAAPIQRAIMAGDRETGVDIMLMDDGLDTGAVLHGTTVVIEESDTAASLHDRLAAAGAAALLDTLSGHCDGSLVAREQPAEGVCYAHKLDKREARLDFNDETLTLHRHVAACNPWPVAETRLDDARVRVWRSRPVRDPDAADRADTARPGQIVSQDADALRVATGDGLIDLLELQRDGKRVLPAAAFAGGASLVGRVFD